MMGQAVVVAANDLQFPGAPSVGDEISVYADIARSGTTSLTIRAEAEARERDGDRTFPVATGTFTFVALDPNDKPRPIAAKED